MDNGKLSAIVITLTLVGIALGLFYVISSDLKGSMNNVAGVVYNETITFPDEQAMGVNVSTSGIPCFNNMKLTWATSANQTGLNIGIANYTYDEYGLVKNATADYGAGLEDDFTTPGKVNISYTYEYGAEGCEQMETTETALETLPNYFDVIVLVLVIGVLMFIIWKFAGEALGSSRSAGTAEI